MNYFLNDLPERELKPRDSGYTMAMDKGLSTREVEDFIEVAGEYVDIVKLGWATSYVVPNLQKKLDVYKAAGIPVYFGGTLFEAFIVRNQFEDYRRMLDKYKLEYAEVSDGSIDMPHGQKLEYISTLSEQVTVLSEVGSKDDTKIIPPYKWIKLMLDELEAGSWKVIGEAREAGNVGLFRSTGEVRSGLVEEILTKVPFEKILWEAPQKSQQVFFIKLLGANVNLGNIAPSEVVPLETVRLGLRGDTFSHFLNMNKEVAPKTNGVIQKLINALTPSGNRMEVIKYLIDFILHPDVHLTEIITNYGVWAYAILFLIIFVETGLVVMPFLPGDSLLFAAGAFAAPQIINGQQVDGPFNVFYLIGLLFIAAFLGDTLNYAIGNWFGPKVFQQDYRFLKREYMEKTEKFYHKHGGKTIIFARFIPIIRTFAPFVAGVGSMRYTKFISYNIIGAILWVVSFVLAGYLFGNIPAVKKNFTYVIFAIIILSILPPLYEVIKHKMSRKKVNA